MTVSVLYFLGDTLLTLLKALTPAAQAQLREKYQNEQNFSDGDIYRNLRHYQLKGDAPEVARWWARWEGSTKTRDVKKMQRIKQLCDGFDHLLPYVGLWAPVTVKLFRRALEGRCYDVRILRTARFRLL